MLTPINQIAAAIEVALWDLEHEPPPRMDPRMEWIKVARDFLESLHTVKSADEFYGIDRAEHVINGFLEAAEPWTGALATHLKRQLRNHLHENHQS